MFGIPDAEGYEMFESIHGLLEEHAELQLKLSDPAVYADQGLARKLGRRYAELSNIVEGNHQVQQLSDDLAAAREMASEDPEF
ncbi:PCRF domain-containing protein, partial [Enterococcus faecalis]|uniref:PCRF domain-containing protein n=1 Tax=Enterococcus faecalis TaxID=1351 RepID=UPI00398493EF